MRRFYNIGLWHRLSQVCISAVVLLFVLSHLSISAYAADAMVTPQQARRVALAWLYTSPDFASQADMEYQPASEMLEIQERGETIVYVLELQPQGFIVVTPHFDLNPIVAYSNRSAFDAADTPENTLLALLRRDIPQRLRALEEGGAGVHDSADARALWASLLDAVDVQGRVRTDQVPQSPQWDVEHGPFLSSQWNQGTDWEGRAVFNYSTPPGPDGAPENHVSGCVSTALAQILNYYEWPITGVGSHSYTWDNGIDPAQTLSADFGATTYPWVDALDVYTDTASSTLAQRQAAGLVTYHAGVALDTNYRSVASGGSSASVFDVPATLNEYFRMSGDWIANPAEADFYTRLYDNMIANRPVVLGLSGSLGGHAVVADGIRHDVGGDDGKTRYYHLNIGWGGTYDAWYDLPDVTDGFDVVGEAALDIAPTPYLNDPGTMAMAPTFPVSWTVSPNQGTCTYDLQQSYVGTTLGSFVEDAESGMGNWAIDGNWGLSTGRAYGGTGSLWLQFTQASSLHILELESVLKIDAATTISYWWRTDNFFTAYGDGWAEARLEISTDGVTWSALRTVTEGNTETWAQETIAPAELAPYQGQLARLRFVAGYKTPVGWGTWQEMHGLFVDDLAINDVRYGDGWTLVADDVATTSTAVTASLSGDYAYRVQDSCSQRWSNMQAIACEGNGLPNLSIGKTVTTEHMPPQAGDVVTYTIVLANAGDADADVVHVVDRLPTYVGNASDLDVTVTVTAGHSLTWTLTPLLATDAPTDHQVVNTAYFTHTSGSGNDSASFTIGESGGNYFVYLPLVLRRQASGGRLIVFEAFLSPFCGFCRSAASVIDDQLVSEYAGRPVLFLEHPVSSGDPREPRWWDGFQVGGTVGYPMVMVDSGNQVSERLTSGTDFYAVYKAMVEAALAVLQGQAEVQAYAGRTGDVVTFTIDVTNRGGVTLGTGNSATVWALIYEASDSGPVSDGLTRRYVRAAASTAISSDLAPDATGQYAVVIDSLSGVDWDKMHGVVIVDYKPAPVARPFDTYQAVAVDIR